MEADLVGTFLEEEEGETLEVPGVGKSQDFRGSPWSCLAWDGGLWPSGTQGQCVSKVPQPTGSRPFQIIRLTPGHDLQFI